MDDPALSETPNNPYVGLVANMDEALLTSSAAKLEKGFQKALEANRTAQRLEEAECRNAMYSEKGALDPTLEIVTTSEEALLPMLYPAPIASSLVPMPRVQTASALLIGSR